MLKIFQRIVKRFQSLPEREFQSGRTQKQILEHIRILRSDPEKIEQLYSYLFAHDPEIRRASAEALHNLNWKPQTAAEKQVFGMSAREVKAADIPAAELAVSWEARTSLAPGAYWTAVVLGGLAAAGEDAKPELYALAEEQERSVNTRVLALWAVGLIGEPSGERLQEVYRAQANPRIRKAAVQALRFSGPGSLPAARDLLAEEDDAELCLELALAMGWMGHAAVFVLKELVHSPDRAVREHAGLGLLATADPEACTLLYPFKSSQQDGRLKAMITELLIGMGKNGSTWEELANIKAAAELTAQECILQGLARADNELLVLLMTSMLAHVPEGEAVQALTRIAKTTDREDQLFAACQALGAQGAELALQDLLGQGNPLIRTHACLSLLQSGFPVMRVLAEC